MKRAKLTGATLVNSDMASADLTGADLSEADLRRVRFSGARLDEADVRGARVAGIVGTGIPIRGLRGDWIDLSADGTGSERVVGERIAGVLQAATAAAALSQANRRYFGKGDVLRNASLEFDSGASVEVESLFEGCTIAIGDGTDLVVGQHGVLSGCQIRGGGRLTIHGKFLERETPGIAGVAQLVVTSGGSLVGAVEQHAEATRFAFEPGCKLRMTIKQAHAAPGVQAMPGIAAVQGMQGMQGMQATAKRKGGRT
jgi:uncharacterized protein YjbI with pentapeptide repeats